MKASELMMGDWVQHQEGKCQVLSICMDGITFWDKEGGGAVSLDRISPIPLTEEIVIKNGVNEFGFFNGYCLMADKDGVFFIEDHRAIKIRYVHELQHALRLCGIKKEIVL